MLVNVYAVVAVLGTVVLSVTIDVTIGVTAAECVVDSVVSLVVWTTTGGGVLVVVGPSTELVVGAAMVGLFRVVAAVV